MTLRLDCWVTNRPPDLPRVHRPPWFGRAQIIGFYYWNLRLGPWLMIVRGAPFFVLKSSAVQNSLRESLTGVHWPRSPRIYPECELGYRKRFCYHLSVTLFTFFAQSIYVYNVAMCVLMSSCLFVQRISITGISNLLQNHTM